MKIGQLSSIYNQKIYFLINLKINTPCEQNQQLYQKCFSNFNYSEQNLKRANERDFKNGSPWYLVFYESFCWLPEPTRLGRPRSLFSAADADVMLNCRCCRHCWNVAAAALLLFATTTSIVTATARTATAGRR